MKDIIEISMTTQVEDFISTIPSPRTQKSYTIAIRKFEEWTRKPIASLLKEEAKILSRILEKYYAELKKRYKQNTCRIYVNGPVQYFKFHGKDIRLRKGLGIYSTEISTRDHLLTIGEVQEMADVASLKEKIILGVFLLGLRVGDACRLEWSQFDVPIEEHPVEIILRTRKEGINAHTFVSEEFHDYLSKYIPTLDRNNEYLLQSARQGHMSEDSLNWTLKELGKRANLKLRGQLHWHCGRKLVLRTAASLGINSWSAKMIVGKAVSKDIATYIQGVSLKNDFLKLDEVLRLRKLSQRNHEIGNLEKEVDILGMNQQELRKELQKTKKQLDKALTLLETVGVTPDKIKKLVLKAMEARFPRQIGIPLENKEKLDKILKVVELLAKDSDEPMIKSFLKYMHRKKKEKSQKVLKDFLGENYG